MLPELVVTVSWDERGTTQSLAYRTERYTPHASNNSSSPEFDDGITWDADLDEVGVVSVPVPAPVPGPAAPPPGQVPADKNPKK